jgi:hypothetical protein
MTPKQEEALRDYLQEVIVPLIEEVLVKKLGQAMTFAKKELAEQPAQQEPVQRYSPDGEGGMEIDSLGAWVKFTFPQPAPVQPVAWMTKDGEIYKHECWPEYEARPLVFGDTPQAQRTWVGLTEPERLACYNLNPARFASAIEAKLKEKNT